MTEDSKGNVKKYLLRNSFGHVKPGEMVAILGPSGSGKTSLLSILNKRFKASGMETSGSIKANNRELLTYNDFSKVGAFVPQDDILMGVETPEELLTFGTRLKTQYDADAIKLRVETLLARLGLEGCKDT